MPKGAFRRFRRQQNRQAQHDSMSAAIRQVRLAENWDALLDAVQCAEDSYVYGTESIHIQAGESFVFPVKIETSTARISYAFSVKEFDVEVSATVTPDGDSHSSEQHPPGIGDSSRLDGEATESESPLASSALPGLQVTSLEAGQDCWLRGNIKPGRPSLCEFTLSNEYSFFRSKEVRFRIRVHDDIQTKRKWRGYVKAFREAVVARDRLLSQDRKTMNTFINLQSVNKASSAEVSGTSSLRFAHTESLSTMDLLQSDLQKMAIDPCTRCLSSAVRSEVFVTRSMLAAARRGWKLKSELLPVFLHEALFLPADLHPLMKQTREKSEEAKAQIIIAIAGRDSNYSGSIQMTVGTAWHAIKYLYKCGLFATKEASEAAAKATGKMEHPSPPELDKGPSETLIEEFKRIHTAHASWASMQEKARIKQNDQSTQDSIYNSADFDGGHMVVSGVQQLSAQADSAQAGAGHGKANTMTGTTDTKALSGDGALLLMTNLVCSTLKIDAKPLARLYVSLVDTLQDLCLLRSSPRLLPCVAQGHALHILSILDSAGYAGGTLSIPFKIMECVAAALSYTALASSLEPHKDDEMHDILESRLTDLIGIRGGVADIGGIGYAGVDSSSSAASNGPPQSSINKMKSLVSCIAASPLLFCGGILYGELKRVHVRLLRGVAISKNSKGAVLGSGTNVIAKVLTLTAMDPVAAIPAILLFRVSAVEVSDGSDILPDTAFLRSGSPRPVILAGGRAFLGSPAASIVPNSGLGEAATSVAVATPDKPDADGYTSQ